MSYPRPITPALRGDLSSEQIRDEFGLIATEFGLMPDTKGAGSKGFTGGEWDNATLNTPTIVGGSVGDTTQPVGLVSGYAIFNKTSSYDSGITAGLVGFVRDSTGKLKLYGGATIKLFADDSHNLVMGTGTTELATTASGGFLYPPTVNGLATGSPTVYTGSCPMVIDRSNKKIGLYIAGAWIWTAALS